MPKNKFSDLVASPEDFVFKRLVDDPKYANRFISYATEKLGGVDRYLEWVKEDAKNEFAHWTKNFPKLIQNEKKEETKGSSIEDLLVELDRKMVNVTPAVEAPDAAPGRTADGQNEAGIEEVPALPARRSE